MNEIIRLMTFGFLIANVIIYQYMLYTDFFDNTIARLVTMLLITMSVGFLYVGTTLKSIDTNSIQ